MRRMRIVIRGAVQGAGFRPFVYRLATEMRLAGWVRNSPRGVFIETEGEQAALDEFLLRVEREKPRRAFIQSLEYSLLEPAHFRGFEIRESETDGAADALILPDIAACDECLAEMYDPKNRRYRYPFINCTHCGPRFSIIESLPYDRPNTSMKSFPLCTDCRREYEDPEDRRFHAQPIACPACGPELCLWDETGRTIAGCDDALIETVEFIRRGKIAAVKGLGGFHLICDARNTRAVELLRLRKRREEKPFALMYPSLEAVKADCRAASLEQRLLRSPEAPIALLERLPLIKDSIAPNVAAGNPYLGVMLPSTPLHHLLMKEFGGPVVATSGNLSDEPLCIDEREALTRLSGIADIFLVHNRPIVRHVDDSIVRIVLGRELMLRRARGYAPLPLRSEGITDGVLAVGGHLKNTIALSSGSNIFISQHIGDLENREAVEAFHRVTADFRRLYPAELVRVAADMHPDYLSAKAADGFGVPVVRVQHHHAHVAACMAENEIDGPALGVAWDGTGYGL
ncbi:MAG: carbamoyltransferase HypF, partial [Acidobacteria bacterium]|nr:carbamoyltransferase HypF [Acidobacteriota bacterium]